MTRAQDRPADERLYTVAEAAEVLRTSERFPRRLIAERRIRFTRIGRHLEKSPERPVLTIPEVFTLAEVIDPRYGALVLLGTFGSLRWGELAGLRRKDIDLAAGTIRIQRQLTEVPGGGYAYGPPKSDASQRTVSIPDLIVPHLNEHLDQYTGPDADALVFTSPTGTPLRHSNFRRRTWLLALKAAGLPMIHFHDLHHTGNTLSETGRVASSASFGRNGERPRSALQRAAT